MSFAWTTVALLVLLLPGFLFFTGLSIPEAFTRENVQRSPLGQLAGSVLISLFVHSLLYLTLWRLHDVSGASWLRVDLTALFAVLQLEGASAVPLESLAAGLHDFRWSITGYLLFSSTLGLLLGAAVAEFGVTRGRFTFLARHGWIYDYHHKGVLVPTVAHVLTNVQHDGRVLGYEGFLESFGLTDNGRFSYLVLRHVKRFFLPLTPSTKTSERALLDSAGTDLPASSTILFIEGEDVANVVLQRIAEEGAFLEREDKAGLWFWVGIFGYPLLAVVLWFVLGVGPFLLLSAASAVGYMAWTTAGPTEAT